MIGTGAFFILFAGFRTVGADLEEYHTYYELSTEGSLLQALGIEPGFVWVNKILKNGGASIHIVFLAIAALAIIPKWKFIQRYSIYIFPAIIIYYSTLFHIKEMGQIRHGIAIGFALLSFGKAAEKQMGKATLWALMACLFHYSAICLFPALLLVNRYADNKKIILILLLLFPMVLIDVKSIFLVIVNMLPFEGVRSKGFFYLNSAMFGKGTGLNSTIILRFIVLGVMLWFRKELNEKMPNFNSFLNLYVIGIAYYLAFSSVEEFAARTSVYFRSLEIIILPLFISLGRTLGDKLAVFFIIAANGIYTLYKMLDYPLAQEMYGRYDNVLLGWFYDLLYIHS